MQSIILYYAISVAISVVFVLFAIDILFNAYFVSSPKLFLLFITNYLKFRRLRDEFIESSDFIITVSSSHMMNKANRREALNEAYTKWRLSPFSCEINDEYDFDLMRERVINSYNFKRYLSLIDCFTFNPWISLSFLFFVIGAIPLAITYKIAFSTIDL